MASLAEQQAYRADVTALATLAVADLVAELGDLTGLSADAAASLVRGVVPALVVDYGLQAASLAADYYDEMRATTIGLAAAAYATTLIPEAPEDVVQDALGWALAPIFNPALNPADTLPRIVGKTEKMVRDHARKTMILNAELDPVGTRYARVAQPDACAFCRMLTTRGADFRSAESALVVVGEIDPRDPWRKDRQRGVRGTQAEGDAFHTNCRCEVVAVFPGETHEPQPEVAEWMDQYLTAAKATGTKRADFNALLAKWRELYGAR